jgi:hypothetical protein
MRCYSVLQVFAIVKIETVGFCHTLTLVRATYTRALERELVILVSGFLLAIIIPNQVLLFHLLESSYLSLRCYSGSFNMRMNVFLYWGTLSSPVDEISWAPTRSKDLFCSLNFMLSSE